jgi:signal transduction histidine kinase
VCDGVRGSRLVVVSMRTTPGSGVATAGTAAADAMDATTGAGRPEPAPRPAFQTAGVPSPQNPSPWSSYVQAGRPLLWLTVAAGTVWPLTPGAILAAALTLVGAAFAVIGARDPRIAQVRVEGERWRTLMLSLCTLFGLTATVLEPRGAGYVCALVGGALIGRIVVDPRLIWGFSAIAGIAVGVAMAIRLGSPWALFIGLAVPALASRSLDRARLHREHNRVTALLAERDALREVELAAAAGQERARIARDLHDVLAHTLSGLSLHLQGIRAVVAKRLGADDPVIGSVDKAADLARTGLAEAKQAVAALREDSPAPAHRAADLAALVAEHDAALTTSGDLDSLEPAVRETVFATVREALTNVGRHAPGAAVTVDLVVGDAVEVRVTDDGSTAPATAAVAAAGARGDVGGGKGLLGLRERAALVGGTVDSGPHDGGWRVSLRVPSPAEAARRAG